MCQSFHIFCFVTAAFPKTELVEKVLLSLFLSVCILCNTNQSPEEGGSLFVLGYRNNEH